jgi:hypothetical protein
MVNSGGEFIHRTLPAIRLINQQMIKDLPQNIVKDIAVAVALEKESAESKIWYVYLINLKNVPIENVLITSRGYGEKDGAPVKTSVLRHMFPLVESGSYKLIEPIDEQTFGLNNEYWLSYYIGGEIFDKKFIFLPESIVELNFIKLPVINKVGVMIR